MAIEIHDGTDLVLSGSVVQQFPSLWNYVQRVLNYIGQLSDSFLHQFSSRWNVHDLLRFIGQLSDDGFRAIVVFFVLSRLVLSIGSLGSETLTKLVNTGLLKFFEYVGNVDTRTSPKGD